jgi:hypothetical protein
VKVKVFKTDHYKDEESIQKKLNKILANLEATGSEVVNITSCFDAEFNLLVYTILYR